MDAVWARGRLPALVVCFGGNHESLAWEKRLRRLDVTFLHLQDSRGRWYLDGADGSAGFWDTLHRIRRFRARLPRIPLLTLGQSSGGYAALRIGALLDADRILAFSPQTRFLQPRPLFDGQCGLGVPSDLVDVRPAVNATEGHVTLVVAESEAENPPSQYFFDDHAHLDGIDARTNIETIVNGSHRHAVARDLADAGELDGLLRREVQAAISRLSPLQKLLARQPHLPAPFSGRALIWA